MIGVTERAKQELCRVLSDKVDHPAACLRLKIVNEDGLGLGIDIERPDDIVVEYEGSALLVVEPGLADSLVDVAIDVEEGDEGNQLVVIDTPA